MRSFYVKGKFLSMRKEQDFIVYPRPTNVAEDYNLIMIQSDKAIGQFDKTTGEGVLNYKGSSHKYSIHLSKQLGAIDFVFPKEFIEACIKAQPQSGDTLGGGVIIG